VTIRSRAIYYKGDKEGVNSKKRDKGIYNKRQNNIRIYYKAI
jgi:hypothetical protein